MARSSIEEINALSPAEFVERFGQVYNSSWWVAEAAEKDRPFVDFEHLCKTMRIVVDEADSEQRRVACGGHLDMDGAHGEALRSLRELVRSEFQVSLSLPTWVDEEVAKRGRYFGTDEERMAFAIGLSRRNVVEATGGPFGAAVFERASGRLVAPGVNVVLAAKSSVAHAEAMAFMLAQQGLGTFDLGASGLPAMEIFASSQPCIQCFGMTWWSGVSRLVIGARAEAVERITGFSEGPLPDGWSRLLEERPPPAGPVEVRRDVLAEEAAKVLELYRDSGGFVYNAGAS